jgi:transcriptional regulator with GAF, ATPase, and Fis domain
MAAAAIDFGSVSSLWDKERAHSSIAPFIDLEEQVEVCRGKVWCNEYEGIVGLSRELREVLEQVRIVAPTPATVLITGETGTGKELIANAIHKQGERPAGPFVKLNCAAIPVELLESEFLRHEKGAFTGAVKQKLGPFEVADGGTLFLDEIGDMPLNLEAKLLRVLQGQEFERLGSIHTRRVDVRVMAATNRPIYRCGYLEREPFLIGNCRTRRQEREMTPKIFNLAGIPDSKEQL